MIRFILVYGAGIALSAALLNWLEYRHAIREFSTEAYIVLIAAFFTVLGIWIGNRLTAGRGDSEFAVDEQALAALGISVREHEVLRWLAAGLSNKEIARQLGISPNTVKTHLAHVYEKLGVARRTQAIHRSRALGIVP